MVYKNEDYETVEDRHARIIAEYPDLRCVIINKTTPEDRKTNTWVCEARVYMNAGDQALDLPKAVEVAFEVDGQGGPANKTSALENCATSALGRALRWAFAGSKGPSSQEMEKVQRGVTPQKPAQEMPGDFLDHVKSATTLDELKQLWADAVSGGFSSVVQDAVTKRKGELK